MHTIATTNRIRLAVGALLASAALFTVLAALPSSGSGDGNVIASVSPQSAEAFEGGVDGDHAWVKVTAGEIASGAVEGLCMSVAPGPVKAVCPRVAQLAGEIIGGASGVWAEVYASGHINYGTW